MFVAEVFFRMIQCCDYCPVKALLENHKLAWGFADITQNIKKGVISEQNHNIFPTCCLDISQAE